MLNHDHTWMRLDFENFPRQSYKYFIKSNADIEIHLWQVDGLSKPKHNNAFSSVSLNVLQAPRSKVKGKSNEFLVTLHPSTFKILKY